MFENLVKMYTLGFEFEDFLLSCEDFTQSYIEGQYQQDLWALMCSQVGILKWQNFNSAWLQEAYPFIRRDLDGMAENFKMFQKVPDGHKIEVLESLIGNDLYFKEGYLRFLKYLPLLERE